MSLLILVPIDENKSKHAGNYFLSVTWDLGLQRKGTYQNSFVPVHTSQLLITDDYPISQFKYQAELHCNITNNRAILLKIIPLVFLSSKLMKLF